MLLLFFQLVFATVGTALTANCGHMFSVPAHGFTAFLTGRAGFL